MKLSFFTVLIVFLASCSRNSEAGKQLAGSDSLVINFNSPQSKTIEKTMTTTEGKAIRKLTRYVNSKTAEAYKCGYDGNLMFYKKGTLAGDVSFNYSGDGCHHFIMAIDGKLTPTSMSNEAADFLKSLAEGKGWY
jgi:hypothetical protein